MLSTSQSRKILDLVGGSPVLTGRLNVKQFSTVEEDGFKIENIAYA